MAATYLFTLVFNTDKFKLMDDFQDGSQNGNQMKNLPTFSAMPHFYLVRTFTNFCKEFFQFTYIIYFPQYISILEIL